MALPCTHHPGEHQLPSPLDKEEKPSRGGEQEEHACGLSSGREKATEPLGWGCGESLVCVTSGLSVTDRCWLAPPAAPLSGLSGAYQRLSVDTWSRVHFSDPACALTGWGALGGRCLIHSP